jgi:hypothetical protein
MRLAQWFPFAMQCLQCFTEASLVDPAQCPVWIGWQCPEKCSDHTTILSREATECSKWCGDLSSGRWSWSMLATCASWPELSRHHAMIQGKWVLAGHLPMRNMCFGNGGGWSNSLIGCLPSVSASETGSSATSVLLAGLAQPIRPQDVAVSQWRM